MGLLCCGPEIVRQGRPPRFASLGLAHPDRVHAACGLLGVRRRQRVKEEAERSGS